MPPIILSSKMTTFYKKVLPVAWFGFLTLFMLNAMMAEGQPDLLLKLVIVLILAVASYFLLFVTFFDFVDEVVDNGQTIMVSKGGQDIVVFLKDISIINYSHDGNPPKVIVTLRKDNKTLGRKFSFMPITEMGPFKKNEKIVSLINRVERLS